MKDQISTDHFQEFDITPLRRRKLLPLWIRFFSWMFMVFGGLGIFTLIAGIFGFRGYISLYGFETNQPFSLIGIGVLTLMFLKAITGFALYYEKDYAILLGKIDAIVGLIACIVFTINWIYNDLPFFSNIRIEFLFLIPYLIRLIRIEKEWKGEIQSQKN